MKGLILQSSYRYPGLIISGTSTDVGKTFVTAHLSKWLQEQQIDVFPWKPAQSGTVIGDPGADSYLLKNIGQLPHQENEICSYTFPEPVAPELAAKLNQVEFTKKMLIDRANLLFNNYPLILVEGAGGVASPLCTDFFIVHLAEELNLPIILIADAKLGTISHTLTAISFIRSHGVDVAGVILNGFDSNSEGKLFLSDDDLLNLGDLSQQNNAEMIQRYSNVPILAKIAKVEPKVALMSDWSSLGVKVMNILSN